MDAEHTLSQIPGLQRAIPRRSPAPETRRRHLLFQPRLDTLSHHQRRLLTELGTTPPGFVLYGGTALALRLAHRRADDFSLYSAEPFDSICLLDTIPYLRGAEVIRRARDRLTCIVDRGGIVRVSFFGGLALNRVEDPDPAQGTGVRVASLLDLGATRAQDVQTRARARDYLDMDALIRHGGISLSDALGAAAAVFGDQFNPPLTLKALTSFADGDLHTVPDSVRERLAEAIHGVDPERIPRLTARSGLLPAKESEAQLDPDGGTPAARATRGIRPPRSLPVRKRPG